MFELLCVSDKFANDFSLGCEQEEIALIESRCKNGPTYELQCPLYGIQTQGQSGLHK